MATQHSVSINIADCGRTLAGLHSIQLRHLQLGARETEFHNSSQLSLQVTSSKFLQQSRGSGNGKAQQSWLPQWLWRCLKPHLIRPCCWLQDSAALALQVAVLLLGPRGSGRSTAVRAAAAALGIHFVPFSCHDLKGQTDAETATALKASLEAAQGYAPVLLMLRHFEVLAESPNGATPGQKRKSHATINTTVLTIMFQTEILLFFCEWRVEAGSFLH